MIAHILNYYALDWIATCFTFASMHYVGERKRIGFMAGMIGNIFWISFGFLASSWGVVFGNIVLFGLNLKGHIRWRER
ncbi:hypothetical protein EB093_00830 [bacterium]|nr:hypothetical protein [bacterium]